MSSRPCISPPTSRTWCAGRATRITCASAARRRWPGSRSDRLVRAAGGRRHRGARADARPERRLLVRIDDRLAAAARTAARLYGVILSVTGATAGTLVVGINSDLWWGSVLLIFGAAMIVL